MKKCKILDVGGALLDSEQLEIYLQKLAADQILKSKSDKRTYPIPRLKEFQEHVDDHQLQIVEQFSDLKFVIGINDIKELKDAINNSEKIEVKQYISNTKTIINSIEEFLQK